MYSFENSVVMITGPTGNLGSAVVTAFRQAGAKLVLVDRHPNRLHKIYADLSTSGDHFLATSVEVTDPEAVGKMAAEAIERLGQIDILVNTVGGYRAGKPLHETSLETLDFMFKLNAQTIFNTCRAVIPFMIDQKHGKIINVAAKPGLKGSKNSSAYSAAKSAVIRLTESMAAELKRQEINVNCILPSVIDTPENRAAMPNAAHNRWVTPQSLADVILFLASDAARDIHGAAIPVYGKM